MQRSEIREVMCVLTIPGFHPGYAGSKDWIVSMGDFID